MSHAARIRPGASARRTAGAAVAVAALAATLLTAQPAAAVGEPTSATPSLTSLSTWHEWIDPAQFDYALSTSPTSGDPALRMSNWVSSSPANYGYITQLSTPAIADVGEPGTGAAYKLFTAEFTVDAESYDAQPGLAVEVSLDEGGNRAGGYLNLRQNADDTLTISNFGLDPAATADNDSDWYNKAVDVPFTAPVTIRYVAEFNPGIANDVVKVYVNGALKISQGTTFETYHAVVGALPQTANSLLFRAVNRKAVAGAGWAVVTPSAGELADLQGHGLFFSRISYNASNAIVATPTITGTTAVNAVLTANTDTNVSAPTLSYQWLREGLAIPGATSATYTLGANDVAKRISVRVTASKAGFTAVTSTSAKTAAITAATLVFSTPASITGTAKLGSTLTAGGATTPVGSYTYQWYRDGAAVKGATSKTYTQSLSDVGREMTVKVTSAKAGYTTLSSTSAATAEVLPGKLTAGATTVSGAYKVGSYLSAKAGKWTPGATLKYAFYANGELVQFSASRTFKLTWEEKGKSISVIVIGSKPGYDSAEAAETTPRGPVR